MCIWISKYIHIYSFPFLASPHGNSSCKYYLIQTMLPSLASSPLIPWNAVSLFCTRKCGQRWARLSLLFTALESADPFLASSNHSILQMLFHVTVHATHPSWILSLLSSHMKKKCPSGCPDLDQTLPAPCSRQYLPSLKMVSFGMAPANHPLSLFSTVVANCHFPLALLCTSSTHILLSCIMIQIFMYSYLKEMVTY